MSTMTLPELAKKMADIDYLMLSTITDNGQLILDVQGLRITDPLAFETDVNQWPGVVTVGVFARHKAGVCLLGTPEGVKTLRF